MAKTNTHAKHHDYHLVDPSPWPATGALAALMLALGVLMLLAGNKGANYIPREAAWILFAIGALATLYTMFGWWKDVVKEAEHRGDHTPVVQLGHRYGMILFIMSEVMFFFAWFWAYFDFSFAPAPEVQYGRAELTGGMFPPQGIELFNPWSIPLVNTIILLTSGVTVTWAHHALIHNDRKGLRNGLVLTILLGISFTILQAYEYMHAGFGYAGHLYGSTFYMATGFHGLHVIVGTIFLFVCLMRANAGHFKPEHHFGFEACAWYWHFVDVVWLFLFTFVYVYPSIFPIAP